MKSFQGGFRPETHSLNPNPKLLNYYALNPEPPLRGFRASRCKDQRIQASEFLTEACG